MQLFHRDGFKSEKREARDRLSVIWVGTGLQNASVLIVILSEVNIDAIDVSGYSMEEQRSGISLSMQKLYSC